MVSGCGEGATGRVVISEDVDSHGGEDQDVLNSSLQMAETPMMATMTANCMPGDVDWVQGVDSMEGVNIIKGVVKTAEGCCQGNNLQ
jgi:hypothetical protein